MRTRVLPTPVFTTSLIVALSLSTCSSPPSDLQNAAWVAPTIEFLTSPETEALALPFSDAVRVGDMLYLSGQIGNLPGEMEVVPGGIAEETRQTMENIKAILERNGSSLDRVVKCTAFLADIGEWQSMNEVYRSYFSENPPARSAFAASGLALGAGIELECMAVAGTPQGD